MAKSKPRRSAPAPVARRATLPARGRPGASHAVTDALSLRAMPALMIMMAAYALVYGVIAVVRYRYYLYTDFDLAIFVQSTAQVLRGSLFSSIRGMNWLGDHISLILFVIAPVFALFHHPLTLLLLQCVVLALGALPLFAIARRALGDPLLALALAALYLLHPAIGYTNLFEFHPEVLATGTLMATFWALDARRLGSAIAFATLSLACREDVALIVVMMGLTALRPGAQRRIGLTLLALAALSLVLSFAVFRPMFSSAAAEYGHMYKDWGASPGQVALHVLRDPLRAIAAFFSTPGDPNDSALKTWYWVHMLAPFLFLPLLSPVTLIVALPVLTEHFLSSRPQQHWILFQYTALVTPVFAVAAAYGMENLVRFVARAPAAAPALASAGRPRAIARGVGAVALVGAVVCTLLYGPLLRVGGLDLPSRPEPLWPSAFDAARLPFRNRMMARVPKEGGVVAAFEFLSHLATRPVVHSLHHLYTGYYTYSSTPYPVPEGISALLADVGDRRLSMYVRPSTPIRLRELVERNDLHPADAAGDLVLFVKGVTDTVDLFRAPAPEPAVARHVTYDRQLTLVGYSMPESTVALGDLLPIETCWRRVAPADRHFMIQLLVMDAGGEAVFSVVRHLGYLVYPVSEWPPDTTVRERYRLVIPPSLLPGEYSLGLRVLWWQQGPSSLSQPDDPELTKQRLLVPLGRFRVSGARTR